MKQEGGKTIHQVLARKWRPGKFSDVVGQQHVLLPLVNSVYLGKLHHAYLLTGTRGVGKTSLARILAKAICCQDPQDNEPCGICSACVQITDGRYIDLIEVDAASRSKVEETRELIENLHYTPATGANRVYIIDEVHMFSRHSFNALLKVLEEPPDHITFILATTDYKKIPNTILSRCLQFHLKHLTVSQIKGRLSYILEQEAVSTDTDALTHIAKSAQGSMRDALSLLDQAISCGQGSVDIESTRAMLGVASIDQAWELMGHLMQKDLGSLIAAIDRYAEQLIDCEELLDQTISFLQNLALVKSFPALAEQESFRSQFGNYDFSSLAEQVSAEDLHLYDHIATDTRMRFWINPYPERALKLCFARMLVFGKSGSDEGADTESSNADTESSNSGQTEKLSPASPATAKPQSPQTANNSQRNAAPSTIDSSSKPARGNGQHHPNLPAQESKPARGNGQHHPNLPAQESKRNIQNPDLLQDIQPITLAPVSAAMKIWQQAVEQLARNKLPPDILYCLRQSVELVQEDNQWILCYNPKGFRTGDPKEILASAIEVMKNLQVDSVNLQESDNISICINQIEAANKERDQIEALRQFAQDPVVRFLHEHMHSPLVKFDRNKPEHALETETEAHTRH